jgi:acetyl esterase/lipase
MSLRARLLSEGLRRIEKPWLARVEHPQDLRRSLDRKGQLLFPGPRSVARRWVTCGVRALRLDPPARRLGATLLYLHGGGYVFGSPLSHRTMVARLVAAAGLPAILPDYRLAPEHPFPAAPDDALAAYGDLITQGPVILGGDSAGGGLALALLGDILARGLPRPLGLFAMSPLTDLTFSGASFRTNAQAEALLPAERADELAQMYLQGADPAHPRASPLFADLTGAPPVWLSVGTTEILRDDATRLATKLTAQGTQVTLREGAGLPHVWPFFQPWLPEARATLAEIAAFLTSASPRSGS